jgi:predicted small integral membrane protein
MTGMNQRPPALSDPVRAAAAWTRFRSIMRWMAVVAMLAVVAALAYLRAGGGTLTVHMIIATTAGVGLTVLLGTALMLLAFLSAGSGHDDDAGARHEDER